MAHSLTPVSHAVHAETRSGHYGHAGAVVWLTGLPASGKSTLAMALEQQLMELGYACYVLDGDNLRRGLNADLDFSPAARSENIRRVGEVAALFADAGLICITAFISPYQADRDRAHAACGAAFHEVYVAADLASCQARDPKGLYRKALKGEISDFTGVDAPYEPPVAPALTLQTGQESVERSLERLLQYVQQAVPLRPATV